MTRDVREQGIVLNVRNVGENNSTVTLLCRKFGIVYATLYGGPKSRLRSRLSQWNSGTVLLYCSHSGDMDSGVKVSDFDVAHFHLTFRECIYKDYAASVAAETAIVTKCAGNAQGCYTLVSAFLDGLDATEEAGALETSLVRFIWRYLALLGVQCDAATCAVCGRNIAGDAVYAASEDGFLCEDCARDKSGVAVTAEAMKYLQAVSNSPPIVSRSMPLGAEVSGQLKMLMFMMLQAAVGRPLKSIKSGVGIL